jgi:LETM1 and EF-hand domain-containing protein 1
MRQIKQDDEMIDQEGINSLSYDELKSACHSRGIRTLDVSEGRLVSELSQWLYLSLKTEIPSIMLIFDARFDFRTSASTAGCHHVITRTHSTNPYNCIAMLIRLGRRSSTRSM